jgi:electron transport complex protein RnfG
MIHPAIAAQAGRFRWLDRTGEETVHLILNLITTFTISLPGRRHARTGARRAILWLTLVTLSGLTWLAPGNARADITFFTTRAVLAELFPKSERVTFRTFTLSPSLKARVERRLGYPLAKDHYTIFEASTGGVRDGYALVDDELGQHQPITFATRVSAHAVVERVEIMVYREPRGDEVRDARFRAQFAGKTARSPLRLRQDIDAVSGATTSSASIATGVKRAAVLIEELELGGDSGQDGERRAQPTPPPGQPVHDGRPLARS